MSTPRPVNLVHSVHQRLLNLAKKTGRSFNENLQYFGMERFLYRLSRTAGEDKLVLKGALLLRAWGVPFARPTMDIDLSGRKGVVSAEVRRIVEEAIGLDVEEDGMRFDPGTIREEAITPGRDRSGSRLLFAGRLGRARVPMQVDIGTGDAQAESPRRVELPPILDFPVPRLWGYAPEGAIAEKLHAIVDLDLANSRMKDFFDIAVLARTLEFDGEALLRAISATFAQRKTPLPATEPIALTLLFFRDPVKIIQWNSFVRRLPLEAGAGTLEETVTAVREFLGPPILARAEGKRFEQAWSPGGPWKEPPVEAKMTQGRRPP